MGETLGDYSLEALLGRGAMGAVYRARHRPTGATRAVKVIAGSDDAEALARFRREAEALARAGGDGVVPIHEVGFDRGRVYLALGYMPGGSLRARVGRVAWREAVQIGVALARALARCHAAGLVHRDLKPDNVLFDEEGRPRLADFGLVRDLGAADLTRSGLMVGTPAYMAPEQLEGKRVDARADTYALGCVVHELIAGEVPLLGSDLGHMVALKARGRVEPFAPSLGVPGSLDRVLGRALAPRPEDRYADATELARDLERLLEGRPVVARPVGRLAGKRALAVALGSVALLSTAALLALRAPRAPAGSPTPGTTVRAPPAPVHSSVHSPAPAVEAARQLRLATSDLVAHEANERVQARIEQALREPASSLPPEDVARFVAECRKRVSGPIPSVFDAREADRFFRGAFGAIRLARRFGTEIEVGDEFVSEGTKWAHLFRECRDEDWCVEGMDAFRLAMHHDRRYAKDAGRGASALLRRHRAPRSELEEVVTEIDGILRPGEPAAAVEVQVEFVASGGHWDEALRIVLASAGVVTSRGDRQRLVYALQRAGWGSRTLVEASLLEAVTKTYRDTPEFLVLRDVAQSSPDEDVRLSDLTAAARSEMLEAPMRATAYLRVALAYERRELWAECVASYDERPAVVNDLCRSNVDDARRHARALLRVGKQGEAGRVLEETGGELLPLAHEARQAKTPEARSALVEKLLR